MQIEKSKDFFTVLFVIEKVQYMDLPAALWFSPICLFLISFLLFCVNKNIKILSFCVEYYSVGTVVLLENKE